MKGSCPFADVEERSPRNHPMDEFAWGLVAALCAAIFFGSFAVPMKTKAVLASNIDPVIFQAYKSVVCFATSWLVLSYTPLKFTWWGMVGALIWVINGSASVLAVRLAGIGLAQSLWSSLSIIVSYIWGAYIFQETISNHALSLVSLLIMVIGTIGIGVSVGKGTLMSSVDSIGMIQGDYLVDHKAEDSEDNTISLLAEDLANTGTRFKRNAISRLDCQAPFFKGIGYATLVGVLNGSFLIPLKYANKQVVGVEYLISFGVGAMTMTGLVLGLHSLLQMSFGHHRPSFQVKVAAGPAMITGLLWSAGNFCSIYATSFLGISLGWPLVQCQLLVSALWAAIYYKEVTSGIAATILAGSSLLVVGGAVMLSMYGTVT